MLKKIFFAMTFILIQTINPTFAKDVPNAYVKDQKSANALCGQTCYNTLTHPQHREKWAEGICKCAKLVEIRKEETAKSKPEVLDKMCKLECSIKQMDYYNHARDGITYTTICRCFDYN